MTYSIILVLVSGAPPAVMNANAILAEFDGVALRLTCLFRYLKQGSIHDVSPYSLRTT